MAEHQNPPSPLNQPSPLEAFSALANLIYTQVRMTGAEHEEVKRCIDIVAKALAKNGETHGA